MSENDRTQTVINRALNLGKSIGGYQTMPIDYNQPNFNNNNPNNSNSNNNFPPNYSNNYPNHSMSGFPLNYPTVNVVRAPSNGFNPGYPQMQPMPTIAYYPQDQFYGNIGNINPILNQNLSIMNNYSQEQQRMLNQGNPQPFHQNFINQNQQNNNQEVLNQSQSKNLIKAPSTTGTGKKKSATVLGSNIKKGKPNTHNTNSNIINQSEKKKETNNQNKKNSQQAPPTNSEEPNPNEFKDKVYSITPTFPACFEVEDLSYINSKLAKDL